MSDHHVFGGVLRSALPFPELRVLPPARRTPDWTLVRGAPCALEGAVVLGRHAYAGDVSATLAEAAGTWRVSVSDLGDFDLGAASDGKREATRIVWRPTPDARDAWARFDVLGRVLPLALHRAGALVLHGSAVALHADAAIVLVAPKGHGKSTLALALAQGGGRLLSDDATALRAEARGVVALPGVHAVRLWADSADALDAHRYGEPATLGRKLVVHDVPDALRTDTPAPLRAVYLLEPAAATAATAASAARRERVGEVAASLALVRHATAGGLLGGAEERRVLARAAEIARRVPVHTLHVPRDYGRLAEVVACIRAWHAADGARVARSA